ncbi:MAG: hypothetical protein DIU70_007650 [Bacillota bacterium]
MHDSGAQPTVRLDTRWQPARPPEEGRATAVAHLSVRPELEPGERIYRVSEVRLFGTCRAEGSGVEGNFIVEFHYVRGGPLHSKAERRRVPVLLAAPALPEGWSPEVDTRHCRCLAAAVTPDGRGILAEVRLGLRAARRAAPGQAGPE